MTFRANLLPPLFVLASGCQVAVTHQHVGTAAAPVVPVEGQDGGAAPDLIQMLVENGTLRPEQAEALRAEQVEPRPAHQVARVGAGGLQFRSEDGEYSMRIGGRLHLDGNFHTRENGTDEDEIQDGTEIRRARFEMRGTLPDGIGWFGEVDFGDNRTSLKDFRFQKDLGEDRLLSIGVQKQPYSLAVEESSNDMPFVERSIDNALIIPFIDRAIGVRAQGFTESLFWAAGVFGEGVSPGADGDEGYAQVGRVVYSPLHNDTRVVHLGLRAAIRSIEDGTQSIRLRDETTNMSSFSVVDTGTINAVDDVTLYGPEFALVDGPFSLGGELNFMDVDVPGQDLQFRSWHVFAAYSLTGESRAAAYRLDEGEFKRLTAASEDEDAWELAVRFAELDLSDGGVDGGMEQTANLSLNWYWSPSVRYMLNWTHIVDTQGGDADTAAAEYDDIFTIRAQLLF